MRAVFILFWVAVLVMLLLPLLRRRMPARPSPRALRDELVKDPVCQTYVVRSRAVSRTDAGEVRYFCSADCARRYATSGGL
jgi:YHS domain-containing protein